MKDDELYRPCVGAMIINEDNKVWLGKRINIIHPEANLLWQMPQGGIDPGESPEEAVYREVYEETGIKNLKTICMSDYWYYYDIPSAMYEKVKGKYIGQRQKWFLLFHDGDDDEINLIPENNNELHQEFSEWKWELRENIVHQVINFKRETYLKVLEEFKDYNIFINQI